MLTHDQATAHTPKLPRLLYTGIGTIATIVLTAAACWPIDRAINWKDVD